MSSRRMAYRYCHHQTTNNIFKIVIIVATSLVIVSVCDNDTNGYFTTMNSKNFQSRQSKLLTFNTQENGDISMELAFNVPFISIPVKRTVDMASGAIANVNIGAVILAGAIAFGFAILIPGIVMLMSKKTPGNINHNNPGYRSDDDNESYWWTIVKNLDRALTDSNMDTTSCVQRMVCWTVKTSSAKVNEGRSSSNDKIIDGLATSKWLQEMVHGTAIHSALRHGLDGTNCSKEYSQCKISQKSLQLLAMQFMKMHS